MKKVFMTLAVLAMFSFVACGNSNKAQDDLDATLEELDAALDEAIADMDETVEATAENVECAAEEATGEVVNE